MSKEATDSIEIEDNNDEFVKPVAPKPVKKESVPKNKISSAAILLNEEKKNKKNSRTI